MRHINARLVSVSVVGSSVSCCQLPLFELLFVFSFHVLLSHRQSGDLLHQEVFILHVLLLSNKNNTFIILFFVWRLYFLTSILIPLPSPFGAATYFLGRTWCYLNPFSDILYSSNYYYQWSYNSPVFSAETWGV